MEDAISEYFEIEDEEEIIFEQGLDWAQLKKEIDEAHKRFFEKRGINPEHLQYFEFGKGVTSGDLKASAS